MAKQPKSEFLGEAEIIIIGGGPGGCSTALHLNRLDPQLASQSLLLEKSHHPREKICGGALTLNAERTLADLGITLDIPSAPVHHVQLVYGHATIDLPEDGCAKRVIRRNDFDALLFEAVKDCGFRTMEGIRVTRVMRRPDHLLVLTDRGHFRAQVVVGADGVGAVVRKTTGFGGGKMGRLWVAEIPADPTTARPFVDQVLIIDMSYMKHGLKGYFWEFPCYVGEQPYRSFGVVDSNPNTRTRLGGSQYLTDILESRGVDMTGASRKAFPIRHFNSRERFSRPRMLLVGDALGTDPLFSEGISQAMAFGKLAAQALSDGFRRSNLSFSKYTRDVLRSRVGKELAAYVRFARLLYGPHSELLLSMLHQRPELRRLIGCSYAGTENVHQNTLRLTKVLAEHLLHAKRRVQEFRTAAAIPEQPSVPELVKT